MVRNNAGPNSAHSNFRIIPLGETSEHSDSLFQLSITSKQYFFKDGANKSARKYLLAQTIGIYLFSFVPHFVLDLNYRFQTRALRAQCFKKIFVLTTDDPGASYF